jgi:hypothetical protein
MIVKILYIVPFFSESKTPIVIMLFFKSRFVEDVKGPDNIIKILTFRAKPDNNLLCVAVDLTHQLNLRRLLCCVVLPNTDGVCPYETGYAMLSESGQGDEEALGHWERLVVADD